MKAILIVLLIGLSGSAFAALPPTANACNTPAAAKNPHCAATVTSPQAAPSQATPSQVPGPAPLGMLGAGMLMMYVLRRKRAQA